MVTRAARIYGGTDTVGGNQILAQPASGNGALLDFGPNFNADDAYLEPFLQPRDSRALMCIRADNSVMKIFQHLTTM